MGQAPAVVVTLIERFESNRDAYKNQGYNETQLRREFLDPFFEALGWDVANKSGHAEAYKDVIHEDAIKIGGYTKAPDYCFRIGGTRKFFLEAKKPAVNLKDENSPKYGIGIDNPAHDDRQRYSQTFSNFGIGLGSFSRIEIAG